MIHYKKIVLLLLILSSAKIFSQNTAIDKVLAVVGDNVILYSEVEAQFQQLKSQTTD